MKILSLHPLTSSDLPSLKDTPEILTAKRELREPLLKAFDVYKQNVNYGILQETSETRSVVLTWYQSLLDLETGAFCEVPACVAAYLGGGEKHA